MSRSPQMSEVLQTCRLEGAGGDAYGREDVAAVLSALELDPAETWLETDRARVLVQDDRVVWLERSDHGIARVWIVSDTEIQANPLPRIDIPVNPDLAQASAALRFDAADHPGLTESAAGSIERACAVWPDLTQRRARPLVLRAATQGPRSAALVLIEGEVGRLQIPRQCWGIVLIDGETVVERHDRAGLDQDTRRLWTPRL